MAGRNYYLITALPPIGPLGSAAPMSPADLLEHVRASDSARTLIETVFLSDDLLQRESFAAGQVRQVEPIVLTGRQLRDEEPLPEYLTAPAGAARTAIDAVLASYYRHAADVARRRGCSFLAAWVGFEVALRNALAAARATALGIEPTDYLAAIELGGTDEDLTGLIGEWSAAADPLAGLRILDAGRWEWLERHDGWFSFADDELAAYAVKLMLIVRWQRLTDAARESHAAPGAPRAAQQERT